MRELTIRLLFTTPCLGNVRGGPVDLMPKNPRTGQVTFRPMWWQMCIRKGAQAMGKHLDQVRQIQWDPVVHGDLGIHRRYYSDDGYRDHEAYLEGTEIAVNVVIPSQVPVEDFERILETAGRYVGISPYRWQDGWGRFQVRSVLPREHAQFEEDKECQGPNSSTSAEPPT